LIDDELQELSYVIFLHIILRKKWPQDAAAQFSCEIKLSDSHYIEE
jgi:hypothetical protein